MTRVGHRFFGLGPGVQEKQNEEVIQEGAEARAEQEAMREDG